MSVYVNKNSYRERGVVLVLFAAGLPICLAFLVFAVDVGRAYSERRRIQVVADAAALAALTKLGSGVTYDGVMARITSVANANGVATSEITGIGPRCGTWLGGVFTPAATGVCEVASNSVEVTIRRQLNFYFPALMSADTLLLEGRAVGYIPPSQGNCIRPFGIEESTLVGRGLVEGNTFTVRGTQSSGNWGKIDLDGNSSSGTVYTQLMLNNLCNQAIAAGNWVSAGTGNAQISQVFQTLLGDTTPPYAWQNMVFAVTSDFPNGNGLVQIRRFVRVDLVSQRGNGQGWSATMRIVQLNARPDSSTPQKRQLVE